MNDVFLFTKNNLEIVFFITPEFTWFTNDGISDSMSFYPNQIFFLSLTIKENFDSIKMLIACDIPFHFSPTLFEFNYLAQLNIMAISIFNLKVIDNLVWFNIIMQSDIRSTS